jgi:hypothetical protein
MRYRFLFVAILCSLTLSLAAQETPKIEDLGWMAGHWLGTSEGVEFEEVWLAPAGRLMLGMHREVAASKPTWFEFIRIEERADGIFYVAMPGGNPPTDFKMKSVTATRVEFENPKHDFPQRIVYRLDGSQLCAEVSGPGKSGQRSEQWCWQRREAE